MKTNKIRNDTALPTDDVVKTMQREGTKIVFGDLEVQVHQDDFAKILAKVAAMPHDQRPELLESVTAFLTDAAPQILSGKFDRQLADQTFQALMLWEALRQGAGTA